MSVKISNQSKPSNGVNEAGASSEGLSPVRCPIGKQDGPGRHWATADRSATRRKWSQEKNRVVMQSYYRSEHGKMDTGSESVPYGMKWGMFDVAEQRLVDRKNNILKRK